MDDKTLKFWKHYHMGCGILLVQIDEDLKIAVHATECRLIILYCTHMAIWGRIFQNIMFHLWELRLDRRTLYVCINHFEILFSCSYHVHLSFFSALFSYLLYHFFTLIIYYYYKYIKVKVKVLLSMLVGFYFRIFIYICLFNFQS